jgi:hypothetical protein
MSINPRNMFVGHVKADCLLCLQQRVGTTACYRGILRGVGVEIGSPVHPSPDVMGLDGKKFIFREDSFFGVEIVQSVVREGHEVKQVW